jgi:hypothetical protein
MVQHVSGRELVRFFANKKIATMQELKHAFETEVDMTVYRALKRLGYRTSYSHGGRYYALSRTVEFDEAGLWSTNSVWFSRSGTLAATLERWVTASELGYFADELEQQLHVGVRETLLRLVQKGRVTRERMGRSYLYCSSNASVQRRQLAAREAKLGNAALAVLRGPEQVPDEVKAAVVLFAALLDERQRRLFAGVEALQFGRGEEQWIADLLGMHRQTVARGRRELLEKKIDFNRIRKEGAGRPHVEKKHRKSSRRSNS